MDYSICKGCFFSEDCLTPCESCNKYVVDQDCCIEDEILLKRGGNLQQLNVPYPVRMCIESVFDLITGRFSLEGVSGPVGISQAIGEAARTDILNLIYLTGFISMNLGVMSLLPIPALDGGRSLLLGVELVSKKRVPPKIENAINGVALIILLGFSFVIMIKDVIQIILR